MGRNDHKDVKVFYLHAAEPSLIPSTADSPTAYRGKSLSTQTGANPECNPKANKQGFKNKAA